MKQCCTCKQLKPLTDFYKNRSEAYGVAKRCKVCRKKYERYTTKTHPEILNYQKIYRLQQRAQGKCQSCPEKKLNDQLLYCLKHWIYNLIYAFSRGYRARKYSLKAIERDYKQIVNYLHRKAKRTKYCPYTGEPLIPGQNMQLDHKIPISRQPSLAYDLKNLQWVSATYNRAKSDRTDIEFSKKYKLVYLSDLK